MSIIKNVKLKTLKQTKNFYLWELKRKESLTEEERSKYQVALESINRVIREKEELGKKEKQKVIYQNSERGYLKRGGKKNDQIRR